MVLLSQISLSQRYACYKYKHMGAIKDAFKFYIGVEAAKIVIGIVLLVCLAVFIVGFKRYTASKLPGNALKQKAKRAAGIGPMVITGIPLALFYLWRSCLTWYLAQCLLPFWIDSFTSTHCTTAKTLTCSSKPCPVLKLDRYIQLCAPHIDTLCLGSW